MNDDEQPLLQVLNVQSPTEGLETAPVALRVKIVFKLSAGTTGIYSPVKRDHHRNQSMYVVRALQPSLIALLYVFSLACSVGFIKAFMFGFAFDDVNDDQA